MHFKSVWTRPYHTLLAFTSNRMLLRLLHMLQWGRYVGFSSSLCPVSLHLTFAQLGFHRMLSSTSRSPLNGSSEDEFTFAVKVKRLNFPRFDAREHFPLFFWEFRLISLAWKCLLLYCILRVQCSDWGLPLAHYPKTAKIRGSQVLNLWCPCHVHFSSFC